MAQSTTDIDACLRTAMALHQAGDLRGAEAAYAHILAREPGHNMALHYAGVLLHKLGQRDKGLQHIRASIHRSPTIPDFHCNLGCCHSDENDWPRAIAAFIQAVRLRPVYPNALLNLGKALTLSGAPARGVAVLEQLISIDQQNAEAWKWLSIALRQDKQTDRALTASDRAVMLAPSNADAWFNHGNTLRGARQLEGACAAYEKSLHIAPEAPAVLVNLCATRTDLGQISRAIDAGRRALIKEPGNREGQYNLSLALLSDGQFAEGFALYESRWACENHKGTLPTIAGREWDGSDPAGQRILLRAEQGVGDAVQFVRYAQVLAERGATVIVQCQDELVRLLSRASSVAEVVGRSDALPPYHSHLPMLSLPYRLKQVDIDCSEQPYLSADPCDVSRCQAHLTPQAALRVGVVWAGNPLHPNNVNRSMSLSALTPLTTTPGVRFHSLQMGEPRQAMDAFGWGWVDASRHIRDFADTAAAIACMDVIVCVDTSVAHIAGAMGKPVWVMLPFAADWRWGPTGQSTRWYPSMRLFRQTITGDWTGPVLAVSHALQGLAAGFRETGLAIAG